MGYDEWELTVPDEIRGDSLWKMKAYRLSLFLVDISWQDVTKLTNDRRTRDLADQLYRSLGSICANIAEGYSRGTSKDRARFYEYAFGSARETRGWYFQGKYILGKDLTSHRLQLLTQIIRLILTMVPQQRGRVLYENAMDYGTNNGEKTPGEIANRLGLPDDNPLP